MKHHFANLLLRVQEGLGYKSILTKTICTHSVDLDADSYDSATSQTFEEAKSLVETGFQYLRDIEVFKLFRKPK